MRLVDLPPELVQTLLDRVLGWVLGRLGRRGRPGGGLAVDLPPELVQALLDGIFLRFVRTHGAVVCGRATAGGGRRPWPPRRLRFG